MNTNFNPHSIVTVIDSPITNVTYKYLDDNNEGEYYTFRLNSNSEDDEEYGWQEIAFQVDAVQSNGVGMFPMQSQINYDSLFLGEIDMQHPPHSTRVPPIMRFCNRATYGGAPCREMRNKYSAILCASQV